MELVGDPLKAVWLMQWASSGMWRCDNKTTEKHMKTALVTLTWLNLFTENRVTLKEIIFQCVHLFSMIRQIVCGSILNLNYVFFGYFPFLYLEQTQ